MFVTCVNVSVRIVHVCVGVRVCMHADARRERRVSPLSLPAYSFEAGLSLNLGLMLCLLS